MSFQPNPRQALVMWYLLITREEPMQSKVPLASFTPADRKELVNAGLIHLEQRKSAKHLVLTDKAWDWAPDHLDAAISPSTIAAPVLQKLLTGIKAYLHAQQLPLVELLTHSAVSVTAADGANKSVDTQRRILDAYNLESNGQRYIDVRLSALRAHLSDLPREEVDRTLHQMQLDGSITLMRLDDPQNIKAADVTAALDVHGDKRHIIYVKG